MTSNEIREKFLKFFESKNHKIIPSASLVPENDPSVLFNTAGMQPLVPYLLGQKHPMGTRLADVQKCVRTGDIDDVGDNRHLTFFEMLGNWSLGDYFKEEAIAWSFEFLTSKENGLGLDKDRLYVTVFEGNDDAPRDDEAAQIWEKYLPKNRIYYLPAKNNWWSAGESGPCGPDTEIFYDPNEVPLGDMTHDEFVKADDEGRVIEIWNNVFMQYEKKDGVVVGKLSQHNVDTGMGLERIVMVKQGVKTVFDTDLFKEAQEIFDSFTFPLLNNFNEFEYKRSSRIIFDHIRTALMMISDGVVPSNKDRGYILRKIIRRSILHIQKYYQKEPFGVISEIFNFFISKYKEVYAEINNKNNIGVVLEEGQKFLETLDRGLKEFEKGTDSFVLFTTYGFPIELTEELAREKGIKIDREDFNRKMEEHQKLSQTASAGMFKGGLANHSEKTVRLHTAHHLLLAGLQNVIDKNIKQRGSNITEERLRMDFMFDRKLTDEEKRKVEDWVNDKIKRGLNVIRKEMPLSEAEKIGAEMEFGAKYPDIVSLYFVEDENREVISKEFCGGPHVSNTSQLGKFKIQKEEASSAGVRRIKAFLE